MVFKRITEIRKIDVGFLTLDDKNKITNMNINEVTQIKYLGVIFDNKMKWNNHIENLSTKLIRSSYLINTINKYVDRHTLKNIYIALFELMISYGILVWANTSNY